MLFERTIYLGIDPASGRRKSALAAIDSDMHLVRIERGSLSSVLAAVAGMNAAVVALTSPQNTNKGLMERAHIRYLHQLNPEGSQFSKWRVGEYELLRRNLRLKAAPKASREPPAVVQNGFKIYQKLREMGYSAFEPGSVSGERAYLEVPEQAAFAAMLSVRPYRANTLEGRLQRQLALYMAGIDLENPMLVLEEITRHKLLTGTLNLDNLLEPSVLAALAAAYTACLVGEQPARISQVGDPEDGLITLPAETLLPEYR
ncbi:MAG: DUF429 domain-containing protein [Anaerolineales bacterium]|nr:DUF429 domain-containing protein [Anaerolineales bacterium]